MMKVRARAPLRIGISGGGTDVPPFCNKFGGLVLNATIDRYAYTTLEECREGNFVQVIAQDLGIKETFNLEEFPMYDGTLKLHVAVYSYMMKKFNHGVFSPLRITTLCEAPIGSGLGASSTIVVSLVAAFKEYLGVALDDYEIASTAYFIERSLCRLAGGSQDQYAACFGGINFMEFYSDNKVIVNPLRVKEAVVNELESSLLLFFTGVSRESAKIIDLQSKSMTKGNEKTLLALKEMKKETKNFKDFLLKGDFNGIVSSLKKGWELKKQSAESISNPFLNDVYDSAIRAGARAGKISGAGGGGFFLFLVPLELRLEVRAALLQFDGFVYDCHLTKKGVQSWKVKDE